MQCISAMHGAKRNSVWEQTIANSVLAISTSQYEVRLKTVAQTLLQGKKKKWGFQDRWLGDEMSDSKHNPKATAFVRNVSSL